MKTRLQRDAEKNPYVYACCEILAAQMRKLFEEAQEKGRAKFLRQAKREARRKGGRG